MRPGAVQIAPFVIRDQVEPCPICGKDGSRWCEEWCTAIENLSAWR